MSEQAADSKPAANDTKDTSSTTATATNTAAAADTNPNAKYVMNATDNDQNSQTNNKADGKEEKKQQSDSNEQSDTDEKTKSSSSYYLYKSTDPEVAKKFAPKKLDPSTAQQVASQVQAKAKGSAWNTGATMETFDYTDWMKERLGELFTGYTFKNSSLKITEVVNIEGHADVLLVRGKYRPGWEISFECKFEGYVDANYKAPPSMDVDDAEQDKNDKDDKEKEKATDKDKEEKEKKEKKEKDKNKIKGTLKLKEIEDCNDDDDWKWEVSVSKGKSKGSAKKKVNADKDGVVELVNTLIKELKSKKQ